MAQRKNRKTGKFTKSSRRRSKPKTNLTNLGVSLLVGQAVSRNITGLGMYDFLTLGTSMNKGNASGWQQTGDAHSTLITLQEIFAGSQQGSGISINNAIMKNIKANWLPMTVAVVGIPIVANVATKLLRKPVILPANRMLKSVGLKDVKL